MARTAEHAQNQKARQSQGHHSCGRSVSRQAALFNVSATVMGIIRSGRTPAHGLDQAVVVWFRNQSTTDQTTHIGPSDATR